MAQVVQLRMPVDIAVLPDPGPYCTADLRRAIDLIGRPFATIASDLNIVCRFDWITEPMVELWYGGEVDPPMRVGRALLWMSGFPVGNLNLEAAGQVAAR